VLNPEAKPQNSQSAVHNAYLFNLSKTDSLCPLSVLDTERSRPDSRPSNPDPCLGRASAADPFLSKTASRLAVSVPALSRSAPEVCLSGGLYEMGACLRFLSACTHSKARSLNMHGVADRQSTLLPTCLEHCHVTEVGQWRLFLSDSCRVFWLQALCQYLTQQLPILVSVSQHSVWTVIMTQQTRLVQQIVARHNAMQVHQSTSTVQARYRQLQYTETGLQTPLKKITALPVGPLPFASVFSLSLSLSFAFSRSFSFCDALL